ncbi:MAG: c-type cytochrome [Actinomycetota bacterium]
MTRTRSIEIGVGLVAGVALTIALGIAIVDEPDRVVTAADQILDEQIDDAMNLYAQQCSVCHGLSGEGIGSNPPLNDEALRAADEDMLSKIIARGQPGTAMPAWSIDDGGPFSDYQVSELVSLINYGNWDEVGDRVVNLGLAPLVPFSAEPDAAIYESMGELDGGASLQHAVDIYAAECVACHGADGLGTGLAPALNDPDVREQTPDEITRTIELGIPGTLMAPWGGRLDDETIDDLAQLIARWEEVPSGAVPAPDVPIATTEESLALGETLYADNCSTCHGVEGQGTMRIPALNVEGFLGEASDAAIEQIVTLGVPGTPMPAWGDRMTEAEIQSVVGFIRSWEDTAPAVATPSPPSGRGGPPWARTNETLLTSEGSAADWRGPAFIMGVLAVSITLIAAGFRSLRRRSRVETETTES